MYIKANKRTENTSTTRRGVSLDYLGRMPAPTSPTTDPYWTLRVDNKSSDQPKGKEKDK